MKISLQSICLGADSTFIAMKKHPEEFKGIYSMIAIQPLSGAVLVEKLCENLKFGKAGVEVFEETYKEIAGFSIYNNGTGEINPPSISSPTRDR
jgi:hypothetical protein